MGLAPLLSNLIFFYTLILFARALMSWFDPGFRSSVGQVVFKITEPVVEPVRRIVRPMGGLDLSIMVTIFLMIILQRLIESTL